jgi:hypothetical protein
MLTWVASLWDYHQLTADTSLLGECLPAMHRLFAFLERYANEDGLIGGFDGYWLFLDWKPLFKGNFSSVFNMMYLNAMRRAADICRVLEEDDLQVSYGHQADALQASIEKHFWDEQEQVWTDGFDIEKGARVPGVSQHANAMAILLGLKPEAHARLAREYLLKPAQSKRTKITTGSPFFYAYILQAMAQTGLGAEAVEVIGDLWGDMVERGAVTFWEHWEPTESQCHAWSASPLYHLSQQVLGVQIAAAGWAKVRIAPAPGKLESARGVVPTPRGPIRVEWENAGEDQLAVRVDLPDGIEAEFDSPNGQSRPLSPGANEFQA